MAGLLESTVRRRRLSPGVVLLGAVFVLIFLFMAALCVGWLSAKQRVRAELDRIRAAGEPVSSEDLDAFYPEPAADRDPTELWLAAIAPLDTSEFLADAKELPIVGETAEELPPLHRTWPKQPVIEALLAKYSESLEKMHRATEIGGAARFRVARSADGKVWPAHVMPLRAAARMLTLEADVAARHHDGNAAAKAVRAMIAAGQSLANEPILVSQLVGLALDGMARAELERVLPDAQFSDEDLSALDNQWAASEYTEPFHRAMIGARAGMLEYFDDPSILGPQSPGAASALFRPSDQMVFLKSMEKFIAAFENSGPALRDAFDDAENHVRQFAEEPLARLRYPISMAILPAIEIYPEAATRGIAYRDSVRVALAIERFRLRHHQPPRSLNDLVPEFMPEIPLDPFDGQPLRYRIDATEYKVYSVGDDGIDQGGQTITLPQTNAPSQEDLVFRVRLGEEPATVKQDVE